MAATKYDDYITKQRHRYGSEFCDSALDPRFIPYFNNGTRLKVHTLGSDVTGYIGVTTGWRPVFLLMRTIRSHGSIYTLGPQDVFLAVKIGQTYRPVTQKAS
jgi:hypothetical protein